MKQYKDICPHFVKSWEFADNKITKIRVKINKAKDDEAIRWLQHEIDTVWEKQRLFFKKKILTAVKAEQTKELQEKKSFRDYRIKEAKIRIKNLTNQILFLSGLDYGDTQLKAEMNQLQKDLKLISKLKVFIASRVSKLKKIKRNTKKGDDYYLHQSKLFWGLAMDFFKKNLEKPLGSRHGKPTGGHLMYVYHWCRNKSFNINDRGRYLKKCLDEAKKSMEKDKKVHIPNLRLRIKELEWVVKHFSEIKLEDINLQVKAIIPPEKKKVVKKKVIKKPLPYEKSWLKFSFSMTDKGNGFYEAHSDHPAFIKRPGGRASFVVCKFPKKNDYRVKAWIKKSVEMEINGVRLDFVVKKPGLSQVKLPNKETCEKLINGG